VAQTKAQLIDGKSASIEFSGGTASAPSFTFTGDTNTGIYSPGADQVAVATNGTGRLFVDASGRVLVGTSSSLSLDGLGSNLQVEATTFAASQSIVRHGGVPAIRLGRSGGSSIGSTTLVASGDELGTLRFIGADGTDFDSIAGQITCAVDGTPGSNDMPGRLIFATTSDGSASPTERMRIDSSGRVGIGTTSPRSLLSFGVADTSGTNGINFYDNGGNYRTGIGGAVNYLRFYAPSDSGTIQFGTLSTANGSTFNEAARIDSSGRLLIGTSTAPTGTLSANSLAHIRGSIGSSSAGGQLNLSSNQTSAGLNGWAGAYHLGRIIFTDTQAGEYAHITCTVDTNNAGVGSYPGRLVFSTTADGASTPTERMRIASTGITYIGADTISFSSQQTNSPELILYTNSSTNLLNGGGCEANTTSTSARHHISFTNPNGVVGSISTSASATAFNTSSDYRLKENVTPVTDGITRLQQLKPSRFNFIADPSKTVDGFIAHEVQTIVPEAITGEKDAVDEEGNPVYQGIDQSKIVPLLTAALQEAISEIESLKARLDAANL